MDYMDLAVHCLRKADKFTPIVIVFHDFKYQWYQIKIFGLTL